MSNFVSPRTSSFFSYGGGGVRIKNQGFPENLLGCFFFPVFVQFPCICISQLEIHYWRNTHSWKYFRVACGLIAGDTEHDAKDTVC